MFVGNLHSQLIKKLLNNTAVASVCLFVIALEEPARDELWTYLTFSRASKTLSGI